MKKIIYLICAVALMGCNKVLDVKDHDVIYDEEFWSNETYAELFLNKIYLYTLPTFAGTSNANFACECPGSGDGEMYGELAISDDYGNYSADTYGYIRRLNLFLSKIDAASFSASNIAYMKGQAYFLRAWEYWGMILYYGGVPLVYDVVDPSDNASVMVARSSAKACVTAIVADLDSAINLLPASWTSSERGRVTRAAAAALKGRVLLFYASPQFNPDGLTERWDSAYAANKKAKEYCDADGYALYSKFSRVFLDDNSEQIFFTVYDGTNRSHSYENSVRPASETASGSGHINNPTWELVKAFPMANGLPITNSSSGYDEDYFWNNRDPRFYATIAYNGCYWGLSSTASRRQWTYESNTQEATTKLTLTGFYCRKNIDTTVLAKNTAIGTTDWVEIRYAEVLLNLAECAAVLGYVDEAKTQLIAIRKRAEIESGDGSYGITATTSSDMLDAVMNERRVELAFENKRYWDLRRRNMYISDLSSNVLKINGTRRHKLTITLDTTYIRDTYNPSVKPLVFFENYIRDTADLNNNYFRYFVHTVEEVESTDINYLQPKYNFFYLPQTELDKNANLKQTINWTESDYFDPLADE
jgi:starch-binding outer membrane protein, SusD/RagB family